jgi:hypothetical protein
MSQSVEWVTAKESTPAVEGEPSTWSDAYGSGIDEGNVGIWLSETVLIEGTVEDMRAYARKLNRAIDIAESLGRAVRA